MACTSSSTSVAVSSRPSSRAPAWATSTIAEVPKAAANISAKANCILLDIKTPSLAYHAVIAGRTPCRPDSSSSLPLVRRRENPCRIGITVMCAVVLEQPRGCLLCCGVLWAHRRQQFGASRHEHGFTLGCFVALNQHPAQARLAARGTPAIGADQSHAHIQRNPQFRLGGRQGPTPQQHFAEQLVGGGDI